MKKSLFLFLFVVFCVAVYGQDYVVPQNVKFNSKEDYAPYEPQIKETINWLLATPLAKEANKRREANAFFMMWLAGTPAVSLNIDADVIPFIKSNPDLLSPFMLGCVRYVLDNNYTKDEILTNKAGIETVVEFYRKNRGYLKKDGAVEKYEKLIEKGKLEEELKKKLEKKKK